MSSFKTCYCFLNLWVDVVYSCWVICRALCDLQCHVFFTFPSLVFFRISRMINKFHELFIKDSSLQIARLVAFGFQLRRLYLWNGWGGWYYRLSRGCRRCKCHCDIKCTQGAVKVVLCKWHEWHVKWQMNVRCSNSWGNIWLFLVHSWCLHHLLLG